MGFFDGFKAKMEEARKRHEAEQAIKHRNALRQKEEELAPMIALLDILERDIKVKENGEWLNHINTPYLEKLKNTLRKIPADMRQTIEAERVQNLPGKGFFGDLLGMATVISLSASMAGIEEQTSLYFRRIDNLGMGNFDAEIAFLEGEIKKAEISLRSLEKQVSENENSEESALDALLQQKSKKDLYKFQAKIADLQRDIAEIKTLKTHQFKKHDKTEKESLVEKLNKLIQEIKEMKELRARKIEDSLDEADKRKQDNRYSQIIDDLEVDEADLRKAISRL